MINLTFYTDPGHGWIEVDRELVILLGIFPHISSYSYQKGDKLYLEEDLDAQILIAALKEQGEKFEITETFTNHDSPIRNYRRVTNEVV